jgi:hypothetical protein
MEDTPSSRLTGLFPHQNWNIKEGKEEETGPEQLVSRQDKCGVQVPRYVWEAFRMDEENGNML